jgi:lipopolysaccharide/colanic/teichoic acid biosynthesis glycosyltransferase
VLAKRIFDLFFAALGLLVLSPFMFLIVLLIKLTSSGPVFFRQVRVGQYQEPFKIHKFRTMVVDAEAQGLKITVGKDSRITSVGHFLRKTKLDELPQLLDVFLGRMSLVGPRPEVPEYVATYPDEVKKIIFSVKPGITDWASIKMIDENDILAKSANPQQDYIAKILPEKLAYGVKYVKTRSLILDVYLIVLTISKIFIR